MLFRVGAGDVDAIDFREGVHLLARVRRWVGRAANEESRSRDTCTAFVPAACIACAGYVRYRATQSDRISIRTSERTKT